MEHFQSPFFETTHFSLVWVQIWYKWWLPNELSIAMILAMDVEVNIHEPQPIHFESRWCIHNSARLAMSALEKVAGSRMTLKWTLPGYKSIWKIFTKSVES